MEDLVTYFGRGDEFHMAFHFPLMPRLFLAIRSEDTRPLTELLFESPALPEGCQWAMFLRNHDELTLEMVTPTQREYLWREYAVESGSRLNLGIRRRLWPLLLGGRRPIELLHAIILSLPGCAVLYYGDEVGMGDDPSLGDRYGMRTPMQWTAGPNAGFSSADPARLYAAPVTSPEWHFAGRNVASQDRQPTSFLNWLRRMVKSHRSDRIFRGRSLRLLPTDDSHVLAFVREREDGYILCLFNLSRFVQSVSVDLSEWAGRIPREIIGNVAFPEIGPRPYWFALGPHVFYWLRLERR